MAENSSIEWCDHTHNYWEGCQHAGPGCDNCYAERRNARFGGGVAPNWGPGAPRRLTSKANRKRPRTWNRRHAKFFAEHGRRQRVFCSSLSDFADNAVPTEWQADLFALIEETTNLDWLLLTKRIGNVEPLVRLHRPAWLEPGGWPSHVRIGATITSQEEANRDIPKLLALPAPNFLSMEPLLGPVDLRNIQPRAGETFNALEPAAGRRVIDWVVAGGESGNEADKIRPVHPEWLRSLQAQCESHSVPFLFKQWGSHLPVSAAPDKKARLIVVNTEGLIKPLRAEASPADGWVAMQWLPKQKAYRQLDGRVYNGFPS
jgi:protein gp37